ncbi:DUF551 domain-containing protein [Bacteroides uniformis]|uniref:DUF551 domain-containing protein n=1 Tax=Bacteroides uniformis TaxID=820 RepID=UPI001C0270E2|nr:DUF551 domain-containing protein [Bacteroides uniformis]MBT9923450.1 DUF551 domain-containing protein [Bacteroides uniformis]
MKQTLEEAAIKHQNGFSTCEDASVLGAFSNGMHHQSYKSFIAGADWQAKQSPWISVEERLPEEEQKVFVLVMCYGVPCIREEKFRRNSNLDTKERWIHGNSIVLAWFPIPSFDEILEANKDVLERIKEKGDCHDSKERIL